MSGKSMGITTQYSGEIKSTDERLCNKMITKQNRYEGAIYLYRANGRLEISASKQTNNTQKGA